MGRGGNTFTLVSVFGWNMWGWSCGLGGVDDACSTVSLRHVSSNQFVGLLYVLCNTM